MKVPSHPRLPSLALALPLALPLALLPCRAGAEPPPPQKVASVEGITEYRARQRPARPAVPRRVAAQGHRQHDRPRRLAARGLRRDRHGPPARAHGLQGDARPIPTSRGAARSAARSSTAPPGYDRTNYYETLPATDENLEFAIKLEADRMVNSSIKARGPRHRDDGGPQRVRDGRELARARAHAADGGRRLRVAQLRQVDHRQPHRHRARADRQPAGLLQASTTSPTTPCWSSPASSTRRRRSNYIAKYFGALPRPDRKLPTDLHRGAAAGRRAHRDAAPRRRRRPGRRCSTTSPPARIPSSPPSQVLAEHPRLRALGPAVQGAGRDQEGRRASRLDADGLPRPGHVRDHGRGQHQGPGGAREGPRRDDSVIDEVARDGRHPGGGRPRPAADAQGPRAGRRRPQPDRDRSSANWAAQGDWRLYFLDRDRIEKVTPARGQGRRRQVPRRRATGPSASSSRPPSPSGPRSRRRPTSPSSSTDYKGREASRPGEAFDVSPRGHRGARCSGPSRSRA